MEIQINVNRPSFTIYHYDGFIEIDGKKYNFEVIDRCDDLSVNWIDDLNHFDKGDIEDEILEKFENLWKI